MFLLFTHQKDYYTVDLVKQSLEQKGFECIRLNTDEFPTKIELTNGFGLNSPDTIYIGNQKIHANEVEGVWLRKFFSPRVDPAIDNQYREGCFNESLEMLKGFFYTLNQVTWIDPLVNVYYASNKMVQLQVAEQQGLLIPKTLVTNHKADLEQFYHANNRNIIVKMQTALSTSMQGGGMFLHTSKVSDEDIREADLVSLCPLMFQELVEKDYELRIIYIDGTFYTGKIDTSESKSGKVDCRLAAPEEANWQEYSLPENVCEAIDRYMKAMGLIFGAIDMIKTSDNKYIFLEVNPTGEWGMLQRDLGYPIAETIAASLINRIKK
ncbi:MAG: MvdC/MvdD family ATP grasp protein [Bacteroidales bacterium]